MIPRIKRITTSDLLSLHRSQYARYMALDVAREIGLSENAGVLHRLADAFVKRMAQCERAWPEQLEKARCGIFPPIDDPVTEGEQG